MPDRARATIQRLWARFCFAVDDERVVLFQFVFGAIFIIAGIWGILLADYQPPPSLQGTMSAVAVHVWYWLNVIGPLLSLVGRLMKSAQMNLVGDAVVSLFVLAYIAGTVQAESARGGAPYEALLAVGFFLSAVLTLLHDVRRLRTDK